MRILFAGGGTAGHINPAVAIANYIKQFDKNLEVLFVGTEEGMEKTLVPKSGFDIKFIKIHGFERRINFQNIKNLFEILGSINASKKIIKEFSPDIVIGTGGYVTGPVLYAAAKLKIPTLVHESNAYPGVTIRILSRYVDIVALGMKEAEKYIGSAKRIEVTGNPIRPSILSTDSFTAKRKLGLDEHPTVLIFGGSLGASYFNKIAVEWISKIAKDNNIQIIMASGRNNQFEKVMNTFEENGIKLSDYPHIRVSEYIYDMDLALNACDLIIARSGSSVSEMTALGKPAILVPSPNVAGNHQEYNARAVESSGGAVVILEKDLNSEVLLKTVNGILFDRNVLKNMRSGAKKIGICNATERIYSLVKELTEN